MSEIILKNHTFSHQVYYPYTHEEEINPEISVAQNYMAAVERFSKSPYMGYRSGLSTDICQIEDHYTTFTYEQSLVYVKLLVETLQTAGFQRGDRVAIYAKNSPFWLLSDMAIQAVGGVTAPVYDTLGLDNIQYCMQLVGAKFVFVSADYTANIIAIWNQLPEVKAVLCFDQFQVDTLKQQIHKILVQISQSGVVFDDSDSLGNIISNRPHLEENPTIGRDVVLDELLEKGESNNRIIIQINQIQSLDGASIECAKQFLKLTIQNSNVTANDYSAIIYTSGTTGRPKAAVLSNRNVMIGGLSLAVQLLPYHLSQRGIQNTFISYLPLAHVFEHMVEHCFTKRGYLIYYASGNIKNLTQDFALSKPSILLGVPRVYQKIYDAVMSKINRSSLTTKAIFYAAYKIKKMYLHHFGTWKHRKMPLIDLVFKGIKQAFGGNVEVIANGSSALPGQVREFLEITTGAQVLIGYGMTETSSAGAYCYSGMPFNSASQIGYICSHIIAKIVDRSDIVEFDLKMDNVGELQLKGQILAQGYVNGAWGNISPLINDDGFYSTGDLVKLHNDGTISYICKIGSVKKISNGEFVDLELVEQALESSPLITVAFAHAESDKQSPIAIVSVDSTVLKTKISNDIFDSFIKEDVSAIKIVEQLLFDVGRVAVHDKGLKAFNIPKAYKVYVDLDWSVNTDFYTPSMKKKRQGFMKAHQQVVAQLWLQVSANEHDSTHEIQTKHISYGWGIVLVVIGILISFLIIRK